ncbi:hypothetical protein Tco_0375666 [Tanacetum coccineum]
MNHHDEADNGSVQRRAVNDVVMFEGEDSDSGDESNDEEDEFDKEKVMVVNVENKTEGVGCRKTNVVDRKISEDEESRISIVPKGNIVQRFRKKRKANMAVVFVGHLWNVKPLNCSPGVGRGAVQVMGLRNGWTAKNCEKCKEVAKRYRVFNIGGVVCGRIVDCHSCSISLEQVKDIRELIGVSWVKADAERMMDNDGHKAFAERNDDAVTKQQ